MRWAWQASALDLSRGLLQHQPLHDLYRTITRGFLHLQRSPGHIWGSPSRKKKEQQGHFTRCGFDIILSFGKWDYLESSQLKYWNMYWDILGHDSFWWQTINWTSLKQLRSHCIQEAIFPNLCASQCHMDHIGLWRNMSLMNLILKYFWTSGTIFMYKKDYCGTWFMILKHQVP